MQTAILAGGLASRIRPLSEIVPNALVSVEDRPFLAYQLDLLRANGVRRIVLCVGHLAQKVRTYFRDGSAFGVSIEYSEDGARPLGSAGALRKARHLLDEMFFVNYSDMYLVVQYPRVWSYFRRFDKLGLLVLNQVKDDRKQGTCRVEKGLVTRFAPGEPGMNYSDTGVCVLRREALSLVPAKRRRDLPWLFNELARRDQLIALRTESPLHSIASHEGLREFRQYIAAMSV